MNKSTMTKRILTFFVVAALGAGCAEKIPDDVSEDLQQNALDMGIFKSGAKIQTLGAGAEGLSADATSTSTLAINEKEYRAVKMTSGDAHLANLFKDLKIESSQDGEEFDVQFEFTQNYLVAYVQKNQDLSTHWELTRNKNNGLVPLFQYKVENYGILENDKNNLGEETPTIVFRTREKEESTHVRISNFARSRELSGLRGMEQSKVDSIHTKSAIEAKLWKMDQLLKLVSSPGVLQKIKNFFGFGEKPGLVKAIVLDEKLFVLKPSKTAELTDLQKAAAELDPRLATCSEETAATVGLEVDDCVLVPLHVFNATGVTLEQVTDQNEPLASSTLKTGEGVKTDLLHIDNDQEIKNFDYAKSFGLTKDRAVLGIDSELLQSQGIRELLARGSFDPESVILTLIDGTLYVQKLLSSSELTEFQRELVAAGDQRIVKTKEGLYALPVATLSLKYKSVLVEDVPGSQLKDLTLISEVEDLATLVEVDLNQQPLSFSLQQAVGLGQNDLIISKTTPDVLAVAALQKILAPYLTEGSEVLILDQTLYVLVKKKLSELSDLEKEGLQQKDARFQSCGDDCVLMPSAYIGFSYKTVILEEVPGNKVKRVTLPAVNKELASLIHIDLGQKVKQFTYLTDELPSRALVENVDKYHNKLWTRDEIESKLGISLADYGNPKFVKTIVEGGKLYVLVPAKFGQLSKMEQAALKIGDQRVQACAAPEAQSLATTQEDCFLKPVAMLDIDLVKMVVENDINTEHPRINVVEADQSDLLYIEKGQKLKVYEYAKPVNLVDKQLLHIESNFDTESEYLYLVSTLETPREVVAARPFYQGMEKLVKLRWKEDGLEVYQPEEDDRFQDGNDRNDKPVIKISGEPVDFKCVEDELGRCSPTVDFDQKKPVAERAFFIPNEKEALNHFEVNDLDILGVLDIGTRCINQVDEEILKLDIEKGAIGITVQRTFRIDPKSICALRLFFNDDLDQASFKVKYYYSIVKLKDLESKDYQPINYPKSEHSTFGYFNNEIKKLGVIFDPLREKIEYRVNRFNPANGPVVYHLSDTFNKPENLYLKDATYKAIDRMNMVLKNAKVNLSIKLEEPSGKVPGDLRNNMIVLIDDPLSNGLLGYGPSVSHPRTGEILQAHTNMYSGVLKSTVRRTYNHMRDISVQKAQAAAEAEAPVEAETPEEAPAETPAEGAGEAKGLAFADSSVSFVSMNLGERTIRSIELEIAIEEAKERALVAGAEKVAQIEAARKRHAHDHQHHADPAAKKAFGYDYIEEASKNNAYHVEMFNFEGLANFLAKSEYPEIYEIEGIKADDGSLKPWEELNEEQQERAAKVVMVHSYTATFIHEIGHNLGLRHNFAGSFDKENFYTKEESEALGHHTQPQYSSIMDYSFSELNQLSTFGKYDLAALRYSYSRTVDVVQSEGGALVETLSLRPEQTLTSVKNSLAAGTRLKSYDFCTDENAGTSSRCNRFDEGTSFVDIAKHYQYRYDQEYKHRNFKDFRNKFSNRGIDRYVQRTERTFKRVRGLLEDWERFADIFGYEILEAGCSPEQLENPRIRNICLMINDRRDAARLAGEFFLKILSTPDHLCSVEQAAEEENGEPEIKYIKLADIYDDIQFQIDYVPNDCFDPAVVKKLAADNQMLRGQKGRFFNDLDDPTSSLVSDISVRGTWSDKVLAMRHLTLRYLGITATEDGYWSIADLEDYGSTVKHYVNHLILGEELRMRSKIFTDKDGKEYTEEKAVSFSGGDYRIPEQPTIGVIRFLGLDPLNNMSLPETLLATLIRANATDDLDRRKASQTLEQSMGVMRLPITAHITNPEVETFTQSPYIYAATKDNTVAYNLMRGVKNVELLDQLKPEEFAIILATKTALPKDLTADEKRLTEYEGLVDDLDNLIAALERLGPNLPDPETRPEPVRTIFILGLEGMKAFKAKIEAARTLPEGTSHTVQAAFALDQSTLEDYLTGSLKERVRTYADRLFLLPVLDVE